MPFTISRRGMVGHVASEDGSGRKGAKNSHWASLRFDGDGFRVAWVSISTDPFSSLHALLSFFSRLFRDQGQSLRQRSGLCGPQEKTTHLTLESQDIWLSQVPARPGGRVPQKRAFLANRHSRD